MEYGNISDSQPITRVKVHTRGEDLLDSCIMISLDDVDLFAGDRLNEPLEPLSDSPFPEKRVDSISVDDESSASGLSNNPFESGKNDLILVRDMYTPI